MRYRKTGSWEMETGMENKSFFFLWVEVAVGGVGEGRRCVRVPWGCCNQLQAT